MSPEEHAELLRQMVEQHKTLIDENREFMDEARAADREQAAKAAQGEQRSKENRRSMFAAMAMQGALGGAPGGHLHPDRLVKDSVALADALIAELDAPRTGLRQGDQK